MILHLHFAEVIFLLEGITFDRYKTASYLDEEMRVITITSVDVFKMFTKILQGFVLLPLSAGKRVCRRGIWEGTIPACGKASIFFLQDIKKGTLMQN
jgi:hypothetical protein